MKKILLFLLSVSIISCLFGCSNNNANSTGENEKDDQTAESIDVEKNLFDVEITVPTTFFTDVDDVTQEYLDTLVTDGIKSVTLNSNNTVTYVMTKAKHSEMLDEFKKGMDEMIAEMTSDSDYGITKVEYNNNMDTFDVYMDSEEIGLYAAFASIAFVPYGLLYNTFNGKEKSKITVNYIGASGAKVDSTEVEGTFEEIMNELNSSFGG